MGNDGLPNFMHMARSGGIFEKGLIGLAIFLVIIGIIVTVASDVRGGLVTVFIGLICGGAWYFYVKTQQA